MRDNGEPFSATDLRELLGRSEEDPDAIEELEEFTGEDNVFDVLSILGLNVGLNEMSTSGGMQDETQDSRVHLCSTRGPMAPGQY